MWRKVLLIGLVTTLTFSFALANVGNAIGEDYSGIGLLKAKIENGETLTQAEKDLAIEQGYISNDAAPIAYYREANREDVNLTFEDDSDVANWGNHDEANAWSSVAFNATAGVGGTGGLVLSDGGFTFLMKRAVSMTAGAGYTLSVDVFNPSFDGAELALTVEGLSTVAPSVVTTSLSTDFVTYTLEGVADAGTGGYIRFHSLGSGDPSTITIDNLSFMEEMGYFFEGFEDAPLAGWTLDPATGTGAWLMDAGDDHGPGAVVEGDSAIFFNDYDYSSGTTGTITSPAIDLSGATAPRLSFYYQDASGSDVVDVLASTDGTSFTSIYTTDSSVPEWTEIIVDLTSYAGNATVYIQFAGLSVYGVNNPHIDAMLVAEAPTGPVLGLSAVALDLGDTPLGLMSQMVLTINNSGGGDLNISDISASDAAFTADMATAVVAAGDMLDVVVTFTPTAEMAYAAELTIVSDDAMSPAIVTLAGAGTPALLSAGGPDATGYMWYSNLDVEGPAFAWIDTVGATDAGIANGDDYRGTIDLPFEIRFYNNLYTQITATTNGWIGMGPSTGYSSSYWTNTTLPSTTLPDNIIAPLWDDFKAGDSPGSTSSAHGTIQYKTMGTAPDRQFVVIFDEIVRGTYDTDYFSFEVIFDEATSDFTIQYLDVTGNSSADNGVGGTIGIENADATDALEYSYNGTPQLIYDGMAIKFVTPPPPSGYTDVVMINEIHYNPSSDQGSDNDFEFAELYNASDAPIDMTGWFLNDVALDVTIDADSFVVVAYTGATYAALNVPVVDAAGYFGLSNTAGTLEIVDATGLVVDHVEYTDDPPWPSAADGTGPSMELMDAMYDNSMGESWQASFVANGTPGLSNSTAPPAIPYLISELQTVDHSGDMVSVTGIVMSVFEGLYTVQEASGAFSGIWVSGADVAVGDSVTVEGIVGESYDLTQITAANLILHGSNYDLFAPAVMPTGSISVEDYEGVLVFTSGDVDNADLGFGEWSIDDGSGAVVIDDLGYAATPALGVFFEVAGPVYYAFGAYKIEPRDEMDVIDWSPGNYCENPLDYGVAGDAEATGSIEAYGAMWYVVETTEDFDSLYVSLCGSDFDTKLEVWAACDAEAYLAYNDDNFAACGAGNNSQIEMVDVPMGLYYVKVYGWSSSFGTYALNIWGANGIAPGSTCDTAIDAVLGENAADGSAQWFAYTATSNDIIKITSQNETGDAPWDTRLDVFDGCDEEALLVASNDDCCGYWGPSGVEFLGTTGMTYYILWDDNYTPGPFAWFIDEAANAPSELMAEGHDGYVDLSWMPPVGAVIASTNDASFAATNNNNSIMKLAGMKADAQAALEAKRSDAPAYSELSLADRMNMRPLDRHSGMLFPIQVENSGLRTVDVTVSVTVDGFPSEAAWNVWDYTLGTYLYAADLLFTAAAENQTVVLPLEDGLYSVDVFDTYGDGGVAGQVSLGDGTILAMWAASDYANFGEFGFQILEGAVYGCTDVDAINYDAAATLDDGSCYYEGDFCDVAIPVVDGVNAASGAIQWFEYTATMDGEITVSSQNEAGDAGWDTYVFIFDTCDPEAPPIASNDDGFDYVGPSEVSFPSTSGMTYFIAWDDIWTPGPFEFFLDEHELILCDDTIVPEGVAEVEPNGGANSDPVEYDPRVCGDLITGTYWASAIDGRDTDWYNFTLTEHAIVEAFVDVSCGDPMIFIIDENVAIVAQGADNGEGMGESLMSDILPPGDYWFWIGSQVFEGFGDEYNYNAGFTCTPMEPTSYTVYRDDALLETGIYDMQYRDAAVANGTEYCYTVSATMDEVETAESNVACATPNLFFPEPMGLMAAAYDADVELAWSAPFPMGQIAYDDGTAESWYWVGGPSTMDQMFYARLMVPSDGVITHIAVWHAADAMLNWTSISVTGDDGSGAPDLANAYEVFMDVPVETPIGAGGEWAVLELNTPAMVTGGNAMYIVTQWPDASNEGPFVATDDDTDLGNGAWTNTGGATWNAIPGTFIMRAYMQDATSRENIEITAVPRDVTSSLPVIALDDQNKTLSGKIENISLSLAAPSLQSNAMRELTSYNVYRGEEPGAFTMLADNVVDTYYSDMSVTNGTPYFYAVSAVYDGTSESGFSNEVLALPLGAGAVPYANNFDETNGGFFGGGEWQWGAPLDPPGSASAPNVWGTILDGPHGMGMSSFLEMPFDLSGSEHGYELSFMSFQDIEENWDFGYVAVDHDGDANYDILATFTGQLGVWQPESVIIPPMYSTAYTKVAFIFVADGSVAYDGWYIDDVEVNEFLPAIMTVTPESITDAIVFPEMSSTHDFVVGNVGGLDLEYYGMIEYIDGITLDSVFFETFDGGLSDAWTVVDGSADGFTWGGLVDDAGNTVDGTPFVMVDSDAAGSVDMDEELISPVVDTEGALSLTLEFDQYFNAYSGNEIADVDVWDGIEWVNVYSTSEDMGFWLDADHPVIDITAFANADLQVRFHYYNANYEWYWAVDNVLITVEEGAPWVTIDGGVAFDGMIATAGADNTHLLSLNIDGLENGVYHANVWLMSNGGEMVVPVELVVSGIVSTDDNQRPTKYALEQNYPNPFNPVTSIQYALPEATDVRIIVYNVLGQKVVTLVEEHKNVGYHNVMWTGTDQLGNAVSSGVYLYRIETANFSDVKKLMLLK